MIAVETPRHLQDAAADELSRLLKAGVLEPVQNPIKNCSRVFLVQKNNKDGTIKACLVTDLRKVNPNMERVGTPFDGSSHILKVLEPEETMFSSVDMSSGYHQVELDEETSEMCAFSTRKGQYQYTKLPMGLHGSGMTFQKMITLLLSEITCYR